MDLFKALNVPIGLIQSAHGGASLETFVSRNAIDNSNEFKFRSTNLFKVDIPLIGTAGFYYSANIDAIKTGQGSGTVSGDVILGAIKFIIGEIPFTLLGYVSASANLQLTSSSLLNFNYSSSGAFILHAALRIEERNPANTVVNTVYFKDCGWTVGGGNDTTGHLRFLTIDAVGCVPAQTVSFVFFISDTLGKVDLNNGLSAIVTPKTVESVVSINNWNYADKANTISLVYGTVSGAIADAGSVSVSGNVLKSGSGNNQVYAAYASVASVNGATATVTVAHADYANVTAIVEDSSNNAFLSAIYGGVGGVKAKVTTITFPAGASSITYDPTVGSGDYLQSSDAKTFIFSVLLFAIVALF